MVALLGSAAGLSFAGSRWATEAHPIAAFYSIAFRFWELGAGSVAVSVDRFKTSSRCQIGPAWRRPWPWVGLLTAAAGLFLADPRHFPYPWALAAVAGTLLMIGGANAPDHIVRRSVLRRRRSVDRKTFLLPLPLALAGVCLPAMDRRAGRRRDTGGRRWQQRDSGAWPRIASLKCRHGTVARCPGVSRWSGLHAFSSWCCWGGSLPTWCCRAPGELSVVSRNSADWYPEAGEQTIAGAERRCTVRTDRTVHRGRFRRDLAADQLRPASQGTTELSTCWRLACASLRAAPA